jgi:hypothetical protein
MVVYVPTYIEPESGRLQDRTQNYETEIVPEELVWNFHPKLPIRIKTSERFMREIRMKDWFAKIAALLHLIQSEND